MKVVSGFEIVGPRASAQREIFDRIGELKELRKRIADRRSFLFHGPAGVGKTLLLSAVCQEFPDVLYSSQTQTPQALYRNLAESLSTVRDQTMNSVCPSGTLSLHGKTAVAVKGIVKDVLRNSNYLVVLDHLMRPSQSLAASARELILDCSVPVIAVSRSAHMEDVGFILPLFPDRAERLALPNFDSETAGMFAEWFAKRKDLIRREPDTVSGEGSWIQRRKSWRDNSDDSYGQGTQVLSRRANQNRAALHRLQNCGGQSVIQYPE